MARKLLITGGSGFVGKSLIRRLMDRHSDLEIFNLATTPVDGTVHIPLERNERFDFSVL